MNQSPPLKSAGRSRRSAFAPLRFKDHPLQVKLTLAVVLITALALLVVGYMVDRRASAELRHDVGLGFNNRAEARAQVISEWVDQQADGLATAALPFKDELRTINASYAEDPEAATLEREALLEDSARSDLLPPNSSNTDVLTEYIAQSPENVSVFLTDRYGVLVAASDRVSQFVYADEGWWQRAWNGGQGAVYVGSPEPYEGILALPIAVPVMDARSGSLLGIIHGRYRLNELYEIVEALRFGETGRGMLIFPGAQALTAEATFEPLEPELRDALARVVNQAYAEVEVNGEPSLTSQAAVDLPGGTAPEGAEWRLVIVQQLSESMEPVHAARITRLITGLAFLLVISVLGYVLAFFITRPIEQLATTVQEFGAGNYSKRASLARQDEIGQLAEAFNDMADAIQTREIELQQWSSTLDRLVKERTSELTQTNESLQQEIAERKRIQLEVMLERIRLSALIESSYDGLLLIGTDLRIQVINQRTLRLLDLPGIPQDWLDYTIGDLQETEDGTILEGLKRLQEVMAAPSEDDPANSGEFHLQGNIIQWANLPVEADGVPFGRLIVLRDVTQSRLLEQFRDDLLHTMVHDLRNPLGSIAVALELFKDDPVTDDQKQMLSIAADSLDRVSNMVNAILDIGRLEAGSMPLEREVISMRAISDAILKMQLPLAQQKSLTLEHQVPADLPAVEVDRDLIGRVLQNLVGNAIKFTPEGGKIALTAQPAEGMMLVTVEDTGPGIAPDVRDRLFRKFATGKQRGRGSGLGLAFSRLAIEAHGGAIWVESTSEDGTTFKFTLPLANNQEAGEDAAREGQSEQAPSP